MSEINKTIAEVLRLDELSEDLSPAPWHVSGVDSQDVRDDADEAAADAYCSNDAALIAYYRTAAPALAREVQRLQAEIQPRIDRSIAFQEAMEEAEAERDAALAEVQRLQAEVQRLQGEVDVLEGRAWVCQGPDCYAIHPMTTAPVYGEYPEDGDVFCSPACLDAYNLLGDEVIE